MNQIVPSGRVVLYRTIWPGFDPTPAISTTFAAEPAIRALSIIAIRSSRGRFDRLIGECNRKTPD
jgi:hypothetical protein